MKKPKANEPSLRDKLSVDFVTALQSDFADHRDEVIEQLRMKAPDKYASLVVQLIAATHPQNPHDLSQSKDMDDFGRRLLVAVGGNEYEITGDQVRQAIAVHENYEAELTRIANNWTPEKMN